MSRPPSIRPTGDIPFHDIFDMSSDPRPMLPDGPLIVAVARNEMLRLPDFLRHHRQIGIRHFLIVDNGSTDGTSEYLDAQPDVTRYFSARHFPTFKLVFRPWLADTYGVGRWILAPDIDEHFVYPGWPDTPLDTLLEHWQEAGCEAVFAPMVDMYCDRPLRATSHAPGARLAEIYSYFDGDGYWIAPPKPSVLRASPTPPAILYGGARDRFDRNAAPDLRDRLMRLLVRGFMDYRNPKHPRRGAGLLHRLFMQRRMKRGPRSKVPLVHWRRGLTFRGSNHQIYDYLKLAPDWAALLHFRLMVDHVDKETQRDELLDRADADRLEHYKALERSDLMWWGSRQLKGWQDLEAAGLIRVSRSLLERLDLDDPSIGRECQSGAKDADLT